jgi:pyrroloquinoline quinone (PQQ) biosynthesis protein C
MNHLNDIVRLLQRQTRAAMAEYEGHPTGARLLQGTLSKEEYLGWLIQVYKYVSHSSRFLSTAAAALGATYAETSELLYKKAADEAGHEAWAEADAIALGLDRAVVRSTPTAPATAAYLAWNEFMVQEHPIAFLGTAFVLESISRERASTAAQNLCTHSGIEGIRGAVSFLVKHGEADVGHVDELLQAVGKVMDVGALAKVALSAQVTTVLQPAFVVPLSHPANSQGALS